MDLSKIMWICVGVSLVFCVVYLYLQSNKTRTQLKDRALALCAALREDFPNARKDLDTIAVYENEIRVTVRGESSAEAKTYPLSAFELELKEEVSRSELATYIVDAFPEMEWKRSLEKTSDNSTTYMSGVVLQNVTRLSYKDKM